MRDDNPGLRFGIIGCGGIGELRAKALRKVAGARLTVVSDVDEARAATLAKQSGSAVEKEWQALVGRPDVDAVIVATPHHLHISMCIEALNAGKHVLCEKPLALNVEEAREIIKVADRSGRHLAVGFNLRFCPSVQKAREILDSGLIGELDHIRSYAGYSAKDQMQPWLSDAKIAGGGALYDIGIHLIDLTTYFLGEVAEVRGFASDFVWQNPGCEDSGIAILRGISGRHASLEASWTDWRGYRFSLELHGALGCVEVSCFPMITRVVWAAERAGRTRKKTYWFPQTQLGEKLFSPRWVVTQSFISELESFLRAVRGEHTPLATGRDGLRSLEIAAAAAQCP